MYVKVPVGTEIWRGEESLLADLARPGQLVTVVRGGRGGRGNARFATSTNQFPLLAEEGERGEDIHLRLELKLLADVGIVGAPNAGKSSLLAAISAARPKIAAYPFTTLEPVLGVVESRGRDAVMVDIPGLIEGANTGVGLGHEFLRHIERTRVLVHVVDMSAEDPIADHRRVTDEMRLYKGDLESRPQIVAANKIDIPEARVRMTEAGLELDGHRICFISAATGEGVEALLDEIFALLAEAPLQRDAEPGPNGSEELPVLTPRPRREPVKVTRRAGGFQVWMPAVARVAAMVESSNWNAMLQFHSYLRRLGVIRALEQAGIGPGDTVRIGKLEWEWEPDEEEPGR